MWVPFVFEDDNYLIRGVETINHFKVQVTNLQNIWIEETLYDNIIERFKELNPLFDVDSFSTEDVLQKINLLTNINSDTRVVLERNDDNVTLELKNKVSQFPLRIKFFLILTNENFLSEVTVPLVQSIQYLEVLHKKLVDVLEKKDKEIQEHELENGEISRKQLITKKFRRDVVDKSIPEQLLLNVFGKCKEFDEIFIKKYGEIGISVKRKSKSSDNNKKKKLN